MQRVEATLAAELHKEAFIALLRSGLRDVGSERRLAEQVGIKPSHLTYLLTPGAYRSTRNRRLLRRVALVAPLEAAEREQLLEHIELYYRLSSRGYPGYIGGRLTSAQSPSLDEAFAAQAEANTARDPAEARLEYRVMRDLSRQSVAGLDPGSRPLDFAQACLLLHDAQCVLNRADDALYHARLAEEVLRGLPLSDYRRERERLESLLVNTLIAEAVAYNNLGLHARAYETYVAAEEELDGKAEAVRATWQPHLYRGKLAALSGKARFTVGEAYGLWEQALTMYAGGGGELRARAVLMLNESLGRALVAYGGPRSLREADRLLLDQVAKLDTVPEVGPLHRAIIYKTVARLKRKQGDETGCREFVGLASREVTAAGLEHQAAQLRRAFPAAAASVEA